MAWEKTWRRGAAATLRAGVGLLSVGVAAVVVWVLWTTRPHAPRETEAAPPLAVEVLRVAPVRVARVWEGHGTARAMNRAEVSAEVGGRIVERPERIEPGVVVAAGEMILRLDDADYRQRVAAAEQLLEQLNADLASWEIEKTRVEEQIDLLSSEVDLQEREYRRAADVLERGAGNTGEVEARLLVLTRSRRELALQRQALELMAPRRTRLLARIAEDRANLALAAENLRRTVITSPIAGTLQSVWGQEGELISPGTRVAAVVDLARIEVPLRVPVSAAGSIRAGDRATLRTDTHGGPVLVGRVARISPESDASTRTLTLYVELTQGGAADASSGVDGGGRGDGGTPSGDGAARLLPGQFVIARLEAGEPSPRLVVPRRAVDAERILTVVSDGDTHRVRAESVRISHYLDGGFPSLLPGETQWAVIESGLEPGALVVVGNLNTLAPGMTVRPMPLGGAAASGEGSDAAAGDARPPLRRGAGG